MLGIGNVFFLGIVVWRGEREPKTPTTLYSSCHDLGNVIRLKEFLETGSPDEPTEMRGAVRDITRGAYRACTSEAEKHQKTVLDTSAILDIVGPALASAMPPSYFDLANAMRAHMADNGGLVPTCAISTFSSLGCVKAVVNLRVGFVVTVLRTLICGDRKFSGHDLVNELDIIGYHVTEIADTESRAPGSEPWRSLWVALLI